MAEVNFIIPLYELNLQDDLKIGICEVEVMPGHKHDVLTISAKTPEAIAAVQELLELAGWMEA